MSTTLKQTNSSTQVAATQARAAEQLSAFEHAWAGNGRKAAQYSRKDDRIQQDFAADQSEMRGERLFNRQ